MSCRSWRKLEFILSWCYIDTVYLFTVWVIFLNLSNFLYPLLSFLNYFVFYIYQGQPESACSLFLLWFDNELWVKFWCETPKIKKIIKIPAIQGVLWLMQGDWELSETSEDITICHQHLTAHKDTNLKPFLCPRITFAQPIVCTNAILNAHNHTQCTTHCHLLRQNNGLHQVILCAL